MALATGLTYPNNGDRIKVEPYNGNFQKIIAQLNGNIDDSNVASLSGSKLTALSVPLAKLSQDVADGWYSGDTMSVSSGYNKGNKEFDLTITGDKTAKYSPGMRLRITRGTVPPTQSSDLEASSSQYASRASGSLTGISFTDDYTIEAWVKLESYTAGGILSRYTSGGDDGFSLEMNANGQLVIYGAGASTRTGVAQPSLPLGLWVHVAASMDMSAGSAVIYINGVSVPVTITGAGTSLTQSGNLELGRNGVTAYWDGKLADVRLWNAVRTATQIRDNMNQQLVGNETNLISYFKVNGDFNDSTSNGNNLTGQNSAVATNVDNPMNSNEYAIITKVSYSAPNTTMTVFGGTNYNIPNGVTLSNPVYSPYKTPLGFNPNPGRWSVIQLHKVNSTQAPVAGTWYNIGSSQLSIPSGEWIVGYQTLVYMDGAGSSADINATLSTANNSETDPEMTARLFANAADTLVHFNKEKKTPFSLSSQTIYYLNSKTSSGGATSINFNNSDGSQIISAVCAYA